MWSLNLQAFLARLHAAVPLSLVSIEAAHQYGIYAATVRAWCEENDVELQILQDPDCDILWVRDGIGIRLPVCGGDQAAARPH